MVTIHIKANGTNTIVYPNGETVIAREAYGVSTDTKPISGMHNGEKFIEMDTGTLFVFDEEAATWHPL